MVLLLLYFRYLIAWLSKHLVSRPNGNLHCVKCACFLVCLLHSLLSYSCFSCCFFFILIFITLLEPLECLPALSYSCSASLLTTFFCTGANRLKARLNEVEQANQRLQTENSLLKRSAAKGSADLLFTLYCGLFMLSNLWKSCLFTVLVWRTPWILFVLCLPCFFL